MCVCARVRTSEFKVFLSLNWIWKATQAKCFCAVKQAHGFQWMVNPRNDLLKDFLVLLVLKGTYHDWNKRMEARFGDFFLLVR